MFPLDAILIGCDDKLLPHARRELMNHCTHLEAEYPDARSAIFALRRSAGEKRLLIVHLGSSHELEELSSLSSTLPGWPIVALIGGDDHPLASMGIISIMRAGAAQIVSVPIQPHDFKSALDRIAVQFVYSLKETKLIAVAGATGGSGATSIAINLAYEIAYQHGLRCILADLSLRMGVIATHLNIEPNFTILDLLRDTGRVDTTLAQRVLVRVTENFQILAGPTHFVNPNAVSSADIMRVLDTLKQIADVVVVDLPCMYDDIYFEILASAGMTLLIGEQKLPSIRALRLVREQIGRAGGTEHVVINRFDAKIPGFGVDRLLKPLNVSNLLTVVRDDFGMSEAVGTGTALRLAAPRSTALTDIVNLVDTILSVKSSARAKPVGLFGRLSRAITNT